MSEFSISVTFSFLCIAGLEEQFFLRLYFTFFRTVYGA